MASARGLLFSDLPDEPEPSLNGGHEQGDKRGPKAAFAVDGDKLRGNDTHGKLGISLVFFWLNS